MTTYYDVPTDLVIGSLSAELQSFEQIIPPEWAEYAKTGTHRERPPTQENWWFIRSAAVLRKVGMKGPIGTNHMAQLFGGPKDRGVKPTRAAAGSRNVARTVLQQLTEAGLITSKWNAANTVNFGKILTQKDMPYSIRWLIQFVMLLRRDILVFQNIKVIKWHV